MNGQESNQGLGKLERFAGGAVGQGSGQLQSGGGSNDDRGAVKFEIALDGRRENLSRLGPVPHHLASCSD